jgi:hypothetical protein
MRRVLWSLGMSLGLALPACSGNHTCPAGYTGDGVTCTDIDECAAVTNPCNGTSLCMNTPGSFACTCPTGYHYDGSDCVDTDECAAYAPVSFTRPDNDSTQVDQITDNVWLARGNSGPLYNANTESAAAPGGCSTTSPADTEWARGSCVGNRGPFASFPAMAGCSPQSVVGRTVCLHLISDDLYYDVDFSSYTGGGTGGGFAYTRTLVIGGACGGAAACTNTDGSYICDACFAGFELSMDANPTCIDIDECAQGICDPQATCTNLVGSSYCACNQGYQGDPYPPGSCYDIDECSALLDDCDRVNGLCVNTDGGFTCDCRTPATLAADNHTCLVTCEPACGSNQHCVAGGAVATCECDEGHVPDLVNGGCELADPCTDTTAVTFAKPSLTSLADCVVPDVCLTRGINGPLFNAAVEAGASEDMDSPLGTLWFPDTCANAVGQTFDIFQNLANGVGQPLCMFLPEQQLWYDITITQWSVDMGGGFAYVRTAYQPDGCGVSLDLGAPNHATCGGGGCTCPTGWTVDATSGKCSMPDPCATSGCDASATCQRTDLEAYRCECDRIDFVKEDYARNEDCIRPDVCLARGDYAPLYNAAQEDPPAGGSRDQTVPAGTLWALLPCASSQNSDFDTFIGAVDGFPPYYVGKVACLKLLANGAYAEETWDIQFTSWTSGAKGGGFAYRRWKGVGDGQACQ